MARELGHGLASGLGWVQAADWMPKSLIGCRKRYAGGMDAGKNASDDRARMGLCAECVHARRIESERGSVVILCERSVSDAAFAKYPRLPVLRCAGYERARVQDRE